MTCFKAMTFLTAGIPVSVKEPATRTFQTAVCCCFFLIFEIQSIITLLDDILIVYLLSGVFLFFVFLRTQSAVCLSVPVCKLSGDGVRLKHEG